MINKHRVVILGAGFAGLELSTILSEEFGEDIDVALIEKSDAFVLGYSKLDVMFGRSPLDAVRMPYRTVVKPGVQLLRETVKDIDPVARRVTTDGGTHDADFLVVALGADYDFDATPGLGDANEFYSVAGAERLRELLSTFTQGKALVGVCGTPFKCPPAPSECALMLHDYLVARGVRQDCEISFVLPLGSPVPPSPETSRALEEAFAERDIRFIPGKRVASVDATRNVATLDDGAEVPFDLFLGVPKHRVPDVVLESGMAEEDWIPVNPRTLETNFPNVYAVGDCANTGAPKAGVFAEGASRAVASDLIVKLRNAGEATQYDGSGTCYIEFGGGRVGKVEVDFFSGPKPTGAYHEPSAAMREEKDNFGSIRRARWFAA